MAPRSIMLIRHGEKPKDGPKGIDEDGQESGHDLIVRGWQRAGALARFFLPLHPVPNPTLPVPTALYAPLPGDGDESVRAWHTLLPLSRLAGLEIAQPCQVGGEEQLAQTLLGAEGDLLVAWEHNHILDIVRDVTRGTVESPDWPKHRFDMVYLLRGGPSWSFRQVPQLLLDGDSAEPFSEETG